MEASDVQSALAPELVTADVVELPACDFCGSTAHFDGKTVHGPWAYMCTDDFFRFGVGLGMGRGQRLIPSTDKNNEKDQK